MLSYVSTEWKIRLYSRHICFVHACCFGQSAFAFCAFSRQQMASRGTAPQDLSTAVILKRFATALRVLLRAMGFGIRGGS